MYQRHTEIYYKVINRKAGWMLSNPHTAPQWTQVLCDESRGDSDSKSRRQQKKVEKWENMGRGEGGQRENQKVVVRGEGEGERNTTVKKRQRKEKKKEEIFRFQPLHTHRAHKITGASPLDIQMRRN